MAKLAFIYKSVRDEIWSSAAETGVEGKRFLQTTSHEALDVIQLNIHFH